MGRPKLRLKPLSMPPKRTLCPLPAESWTEILTFAWSDGGAVITKEKLMLRAVDLMFHQIILPFLLTTSEIILYRNYAYLQGTRCYWLDLSSTIGLLMLRTLVSIWRTAKFEVPCIKILRLSIQPGDMLVLANILSSVDGVQRIAYTNDKGIFILPPYRPLCNLIRKHETTLREVLYVPANQKIPSHVTDHNLLIRIYPVNRPLDAPRYFVTYEKAHAEQKGTKIQAISTDPIDLFCTLTDKPYATHVHELDIVIRSEYDATLRSTVQIIRHFIVEFPQVENIEATMIYTLSDHNWRLITVDADVEYWAYMVHREALRLEESLAQELTRHAIPQSVTSVLTFVLDITLYHEGKKYAEKAL